ncbi:MAG: transglycosylase domain-containing protein [Lachnospiraceae bacterium]|nr:transglycosylase domain-containing protein [Lachnospiraceae bacterium]
MNYTRDSIERKEELYESYSQEIEKRVGVLLLRSLVLLFLSVIIVASFGTFGIFSGIIANTPDIASVNIAPSGYATFIYDSDGNQLQKLVTSNSNRISVSLDNVPEYLQKGVIAVEDERFYQHNGIDAKGIIRALYVGLKNRFKFTEGASTITQQLLKNNVFTTWTEESSLIDRVKRKFQEQVLAVQLEEKLTDSLGSKKAAKDRILENYLNTINLGAGTYGVQAASRKYFMKDAKELTLSEAAVIAGITQNPSRYNPIRHPDYNSERRDKVLKNMLEQGYITQEAFDEAHADPVYDRIRNAAASQESTNTVYSYFVDELTNQVVTDLQKYKGYSETQAYQALYSGGLRIYTTQDMDIQNIVDEEYANPENFPNGTEYSMDWALTIQTPDGELHNYSREMLRKFFQENLDPEFDLLFDTVEQGNGYIENYKMHILDDNPGAEIIAERSSFAPQPQSSMVIMDQHTGYVKAIVGGRGEKTASLTLNRATQATRQPGSTFKIPSTYAPALDDGVITLGTVLVDEKYNYDNGRPVNNAELGVYRGEMTVRDAITYSINTIAVKCIDKITPRVAFEQLLKFGFTTLSEMNDIYQPLALGGIYNGVTNLELTAAYAAIANDGTYTRPIFYTRIEDQDGNIVIDNTPETSTAIAKTTAGLLTSALQDVVTRGTAQEVQLECGMPVAGKTGTTSSYNDVWFIGYTPYYTCGVWAGYDSEETLPDEGIYRSYHKILWKKVMDKLSEGKSNARFHMPDGVITEEICTKTGLLAKRGCSSTIEYFAAGTAPTTYCDGDHASWWDDEYYDDYDDDYDRWDYNRNEDNEEPSGGNAAAEAAAEAEERHSSEREEEGGGNEGQETTDNAGNGDADGGGGDDGGGDTGGDGGGENTGGDGGGDEADGGDEE